MSPLRDLFESTIYVKVTSSVYVVSLCNSVKVPVTMNPLKEQLRKSLLEVCTPEDLQQWFDPLELRMEADRQAEYEGKAESSGLVVTLPHALFADWFAKKGQDVLESTVALLSAKAFSEKPDDAPEEDMAPVSIRYEIPGAPSRERRTPPRRPQELNQDFAPTFEDFVANAKHKNALTVLRDLLPRDPRSVIPVVLSGPSGSGKTHLLQATARRLTHDLGSGYVVVGAEVFAASEGLSGELFDMSPDNAGFQPPVQTISKTSVEPLLQTPVNVPVKTPVQGPVKALLQVPVKALLVDDMHRLSAEEAVQNALTRELDKALAEGRPAVLAGTGKLSEWPLSDGLRSRLHMGIALPLPEPDLDICVRFLQQHFKASGFPVERDSLLLLARRFPDIRRLTGVLRRLETLKGINGDVTLADMDMLAKQAEGSGLSPQLIMSLTADRLGVSVKDILGVKRKPRLVRARQISMYLCRELLGHSYPVIGHMFDGKDHSTVIHAVQKIKGLLASDRDTNILVTELTKHCRKLAD